MNNNYKKLVIITGVTGTIGSKFFEHYLQDKTALVYGISRRGLNLKDVNLEEMYSVVLNVDILKSQNIANFVETIPQFDSVSEIIYVHCIGDFKTEFQTDVEIFPGTQNRTIDPAVYSTVYQSFVDTVSSLRNRFESKKISVISFGSLTDAHEIDCFYSYRTSQKLLEDFSRIFAKEKNVDFIHTRLSTVLSHSEFISRPYIGKTSIDFQYIIKSSEIVEFVINRIYSKGYHQFELFKPLPQFKPNHFESTVTEERRRKELLNE
jgi:hypothetical protein